MADPKISGTTSSKGHRWLVLTSEPATSMPTSSRNTLLDTSNTYTATASVSAHQAVDTFVEPSACSSLMTPLTPPVTPEKAKIERVRPFIGNDSNKLIDSPTVESKSTFLHGTGLGISGRPKVEHTFDNRCELGPLSDVPVTARSFGTPYQLREELGHGAWSIVYSACEISSPQFSGSMPPSPPTTPQRPSNRGNQHKVLAVKVLDRRDGRKILEKEARILTYLHSHEEAQQNLVEYLGFDEARCSIVMVAVPLSLETHAKAAGKAPVSTTSMSNPVIGLQQWTQIAHGLIDGLAFLQRVGCVHGDVKPSNILLQSNESQGNLTPLYCDFSSAHVISRANPSDQIEEVSAVTTDYTAPELLRALKKSNGEERAIATFASDVYALGVTLLFAATGESPYSVAQIELQKTTMALEGKPLGYARSGAQASRVMKGRAVDQALKVAVEPLVEARIDVFEWERWFRGIAEMGNKDGEERGGRRL